jgi:hypothetical protein
MGNFDEPLKISIFVKDVFAGFSMAGHHMPQVFPELILSQLNLKNDTLRRRYDSLKYDIKKIEEGPLPNQRCRASHKPQLPQSFTMLVSGIWRKLQPENQQMRDSRVAVCTVVYLDGQSCISIIRRRPARSSHGMHRLSQSGLCCHLPNPSGRLRRSRIPCLAIVAESNQLFSCRR